MVQVAQYNMCLVIFLEVLLFAASIVALVVVDGTGRWVSTGTLVLSLILLGLIALMRFREECKCFILLDLVWWPNVILAIIATVINVMRLMEEKEGSTSGIAFYAFVSAFVAAYGCIGMCCPQKCSCCFDLTTRVENSP
jgi:hypothetical protein